MRYNISRLLGVIIGFPIAIIAWIVSVFALEIQMVFDALISALTFLFVYFPTQRLTSRKYLKEIGLSRRDYLFVKNQLKQVQEKNKRILKSFVNIRSLKDFKQINDIYRISRAIFLSVKQQPAIFFNVESFFYSHIDNALILIESYTRLAKSPKKSQEEKQKLEQTRITLEEVRRTMVADLKRVNESDFNKLDVEIEVNKMEQKRHK
ncbi:MULTISPECIES: 5-bromo-4-chloroindolyl phosphate hydrolysis family protein [unclassified Staphylococcus]|uniref:5-bromo-4-chloroindolyl phosphate hydrolysis family protein n=1 Tax=unclassified Staphylococcus TaxID=91994 RepID=UPI00203E08E2|nr:MULTISPECIES: 5-bromo-4-chloroindolyl phosphate hydrolysis family protein [unclassified Staphylococcus]